MAEDNIKSVIEALLFASEHPITIEQLKIILGGFSPSEIRSKIEELKSEYEQSNRGVHITEVAGGFRMITSPAFAQFIRKLYKERHVERLSKPALETLAIVAYKQPVTKLEIGLLRNVNIDGVMKSLVDKNLIRISGRKKAPGRPYVFGTTRQFLEYFGLKSLEELPKMEDFSQLAKIEGLPKTEGQNQETAEELDGAKGVA